MAKAQMELKNIGSSYLEGIKKIVKTYQTLTSTDLFLIQQKPL